jgi:predicted transcriptional regulator YdeE
MSDAASEPLIEARDTFLVAGLAQRFNFEATLSRIWSVELPASAYERVDAPNFERYDEAFDPKTGAGEVEIWIPVRPKA